MTTKFSHPQKRNFNSFIRLNFFSTNAPEFSTTELKKNKCWPITEKHYKSFTITKRNKTERELVTVDKNLKVIQSNLYDFFKQKYNISKYAHGFVAKDPLILSLLKEQDKPLRSKGVITNALSHTNKKVVISLDLKDFFPSITLPRVIGLLKTQPYNFSNKQAAILASLICLPKNIDKKQGLPQGAPTSPIISNLICKKLDYQLGLISKKYDITYTRYADDLTFSTNNLKRISATRIVEKVAECVKRNGFKINDSKTKIMFSNQKQMVTGILVNEGLNLPKKDVDALRATLYNLDKVYTSTDDAVKGFWKLKGKNPYDTFTPVGFYLGGFKGRYIKSPSKGIKSTKPTIEKEFEKIYAQHLLGRITWYGQVVTTAINKPYDLVKKQHISPKQFSRIKKYEEMLATFYRISIKRKWPIEHIVLRRAYNLPHLQSLMKMNPIYLLDATFLDENKEIEQLKNKVSELKTDKEKYTEFFRSAPRSLQRVLRHENRSHNNFSLESIKKFTNFGWQDPIKQKKVFNAIDNGELSDIFHQSINRDGDNIKETIIKFVTVVGPQLIYLSKDVKNKLINVHKELLALLISEGESFNIDFYKENPKTEQALQAVRDLKSAIRLYEGNSENFYTKIVLEALKITETIDMVAIDKRDMAPRMVTDINAWRNALIKVLMSIKQHTDETEKHSNAQKQKPFTIMFREHDDDENITTAIEIYRLNSELPFKKELKIDTEVKNGNVKKWKTGGDLKSAVSNFLSIGDIFIHGKFNDCKDITFNLTEHVYKVNKEIKENEYGKLFITLEELNN
ncbi:reverse transcriptase family protein [Photobacterium phosphoreum]|uniref:reverse transcriptase family protein n=1 Tax=Photobacterium phosphoreum TaxID=659 RepID=UPI000D1767B4|nr:reverse transcriptase family protein [Photobacterium phosphoreum]PSU58073.1 hypothetical protein CTM80_17240 [Photobacterium phosphoreum]